MYTLLFKVYFKHEDLLYKETYARFIYRFT